MSVPTCPSTRLIVLLLCGVALVGCRGARSSDIPAPVLAPVTLPELSSAEEGVRTQAQQKYDALRKTIDSGASGEALATAYGEFAMFLQAGEYFDAAEPAYRNAQSLSPRDVRWPYYLGHLYKSTGAPDRAEAAWTRALELQPGDVTQLTHLARLHLEKGNADAAEPLVARALQREPRSLPVLATAGQVALARRQFDRAIAHLEQGLAIDPSAASLHSPLANAYRAIGKIDVAEAHARQWRNTDLPLPDPLMDQLGETLQSGLTYELRGLRAMNAQDWAGAQQAFREGLATARMNDGMRRSLHHKLGTALYMGGDLRGAVAEFQEARRLAPPQPPDEATAKTNYSLGVLMASGGRTDAAIALLMDAVRYQPNYGEAYLALADALRASGRIDEARRQYEEALRINPTLVDARFGHALSLVRSRRYAEARASLEEGLRLRSDEPLLSHALARLLAAAPADGVRDGARALSLANAVASANQTIEAGETLAMALAESGDFASAVQVQTDVLAAARESGRPLAALRANLRLYQQRRPSREPWTDDDPVHAPGPDVTPEIAALVRGVRVDVGRTPRS